MMMLTHGRSAPDFSRSLTDAALIGILHRRVGVSTSLRLIDRCTGLTTLQGAKWRRRTPPARV